MATPRVKRALAGPASDPAQRPITSFFARDETARGEQTAAAAAARPPREAVSPELPPSVQANLLAVGMRVRKSVPEGYKTGKEDLERAAKPAKSSSSFSSSFKSSSSVGSRPVAVAAAAASSPEQRELLPFCGLNKVGGLGVQSFGDTEGRAMSASASASVFYDDAGDSEPPLLTSSQETVSSTSSYLSAPALRQASAKKRYYGDDDDDDDEFDHSSDDEEAAGYDMPAYAKRSQAPEDARTPSRGPAAATASSASINSWLTHGGQASQTLDHRVLAIPRRRQQQQQQQQSSLSPVNPTKLAHGRFPHVRVRSQDDASDFDEADFLDATIMGDMEMGGM